MRRRHIHIRNADTSGPLVEHQHQEKDRTRMYICRWVIVSDDPPASLQVRRGSFHDADFA